MSTTHPSDLELFEYVEGELDEPSAARIQLHVDGCPICAAAIAESGRGRDALRASPVLELPDSARQTLRDQLGEQEPAPERPRRWSPGRLAAILAPIAAVAVAAVVAVVVVTGNDDKAQKANPEAALATAAGAATAPSADASVAGTTAAAETAAADSSSAIESTVAPILVRKVSGPADEVVALLRKAGLTAATTQDGITVTDSDATTVDRVLDGRQKGSVAVFVVPSAP